MASTKSELRDGMRIDWDVPVKMDDGLALRADVYRPETEGRFPVILSYGPYAKGLAFQEGYPSAWQRMVARIHRPFLSPRDKRLLPVHRMGGRAALGERQGRAERNLLLRHQPVARGVACAAAPRGDVHLG